jgi:hypothetical protein
VTWARLFISVISESTSPSQYVSCCMMRLFAISQIINLDDRHVIGPFRKQRACGG